MRRSLRRLVREPLIHFAVLGGLLFGAHHAFARKPQSSIEVTRQVTAALRADHERRTGSPPTTAEERGLVDRWIDDEVRVREAQALGLDRGDVIVRRRLEQKIDFLLEGETEEREPGDDELRAYRDAHAADFTRATRITLRHVFVSRALHGDEAAAVAADLEAKLDAGADASALGDPFLRGASFSDRTETELGVLLGAEAAHVAATLDLGRWSSPTADRAGFHLVRVSARREDDAMGPELRSELRERWLRDRRDEARRGALAERRRGYDVRIEDGALGGGAP